MKIYVEDHDELTYLYKGEIEIKLNESEKIMKIALSANCQ